MNAPAPRLWPWLEAAAAAAALAAGTALRDCVLLACGTWLAGRSFEAGMDARAPWDGWRAAVCCACAGFGLLLLGLALAAAIALAQWGWWSPGGAHPHGLALLFAVAAAIELARRRRRSSWPRAALSGLALAGLAAAALWLSEHGLALAACAFAAGVGLHVALGGWRLLQASAPALAGADGRR